MKSSWLQLVEIVNYSSISMKLLLLTPFVCLLPLLIPFLCISAVVQVRKDNWCWELFTICACGESSTTEMWTQLDQHVQAKSPLHSVGVVTYFQWYNISLTDGATWSRWWSSNSSLCTSWLQNELMRVFLCFSDWRYMCDEYLLNRYSVMCYLGKLVECEVDNIEKTSLETVAERFTDQDQRNRCLRK